MKIFRWDHIERLFLIMVVAGGVFCVSVVFSCFAEEPQLTKIAIEQKGLYGINYESGEYDCIEETTQIPAKLGNIYGLTFTLQGTPRDRVVELTIDIIPPPSHEQLRSRRQSHQWLGYIGQTWTVFTEIDESWELIPGIWTIQVVYRHHMLGQQRFTVHTHLSPDEQAQTARCLRVIEQYNLSQIHSCREEKLQYGDTFVYLLSIEHGPGMDCPSGCLYQTVYALVRNQRILYRFVDDTVMFPFDDIAILLRKTLKISIRPNELRRIARREVVSIDNGFGLKYTFMPTLAGSIVLSEHGQISETLHLPKNALSFDMAQELCLAELKKLIPGEGTREELQFRSYEESSIPGWMFTTGTYFMKARIDGTIQIFNSHHDLLHITKAYGPEILDLAYAGLYAETELMKARNLPTYSERPKCTFDMTTQSACQAFSCSSSTQSQQFTLKAWETGVAELYKDDVLVHKLLIAPEAVTIRNMTTLIEESLHSAKIAFDYWSGEAFGRGVYIEAGITTHDVTEFEVIVCQNGDIQIFEQREVLHQRNVFADE